MHLSPELAVSMIAALAALWQVYVAKQGFSKKAAELPKSNFQRGSSKKTYVVVDDNERTLSEVGGRLNWFKPSGWQRRQWMGAGSVKSGGASPSPPGAPARA